MLMIPSRFRLIIDQDEREEASSQRVLAGAMEVAMVPGRTYKSKIPILDEAYVGVQATVRVFVTKHQKARIPRPLESQVERLVKAVYRLHPRAVTAITGQLERFLESPEGSNALRLELLEPVRTAGPSNAYVQGLRAIGGPANPKVAALESHEQVEKEVWTLLEPHYSKNPNRVNVLKAIPREWLLSAPILVLTDSYGAGSFRGAMYDLDVAAWVLPGATMEQLLRAAEVIVQVREDLHSPPPTHIVVVGGINNALNAFDKEESMADAARVLFQTLTDWSGIPDVEVLVVTPPRVSYPPQTKGACISIFVDAIEELRRMMPLEYRDGIEHYSAATLELVAVDATDPHPPQHYLLFLSLFIDELVWNHTS
jgi:hypothetical protein